MKPALLSESAVAVDHWFVVVVVWTHRNQSGLCAGTKSQFGSSFGANWVSVGGVPVDSGYNCYTPVNKVVDTTGGFVVSPR